MLSPWFLPRVPDVRQADKFFALCRKLGMGPQHFALTLLVYPFQEPHKVQGCTDKWKKMLASQGRRRIRIFDTR